MFKNLINLFYPNLCAACKVSLNESEHTICFTCLSELPKTKFYCDNENPVAKLFWGRVNLEAAISSFVFVKKGKVQKLMHELKYNNNENVGELLGVELGKDFIKIENIDKVDFVIPTPLHPKKLKIRGYNQSEAIARGIAKVLKCDLGLTYLERIEHSDTQTLKSKYERWENVGSIFKVNEPVNLRNKHILIVDDVVTTGATIEACCKVLENIEGVKISVGTLAFA